MYNSAQYMQAAVGGSGFLCYFQTLMPIVADHRWRSFWKRLVADGRFQCLRVLDALK